MKIAQITTFFHPVTGGVEAHVLNLSRELVNQGHEVVVLCSDSNKLSARIRERRTTFLGLEVRRFRTFFSLSFYHKFYPGLLIYLLRNKFDIIHVHGFRKFESYFALFAGWIRHTPVVLTTHNPFPTKTRSTRLSLLIRFHDMILGRFFTRRFTKIIILVPSEEGILTRRFKVKPGKIAIVPNGIPDEFLVKGDAGKFLDEWKINKKDWSAIITSVGRINFAKGFQNLELAVAQNPDALFFIAGGDDGYLKKLKYLYAKSPNIKFSEHFLPPDKVRDLLAASDLFVFPSFHEAFGVVALEAMAQGLPVVSTNVGGPREFLGTDYAILLNPRDKQSWADSVKQLLANRERLQEMGSKAKSAAESYRWSVLVEKVLMIYNEIYVKTKPPKTQRA